MQKSPVTAKSLALTLLTSLFILLTIFASEVTDKRTKIVFCDVGQGDAAYIRIKNKIDLLIDAGPNKKVLQCLSKYMPFWDREIELAFITHPDLDHYGGFIYVVDRYKVDKFITVHSKNLSKTYRQLEKKAKIHNIIFQFKYLGDKIKIIDDEILFFWPSYALKTTDDNEYSSVFLFNENGFKIVFTGDASPKALQKLMQLNSKNNLLKLENADVLKVPHHGSKNGLTSSFLKLADPKVAVISVGLNNQYGHPSKKILDLLEANNIIIKRTDKDGDIIFKLPN